LLQRRPVFETPLACQTLLDVAQDGFRVRGAQRFQAALCFFFEVGELHEYLPSVLSAQVRFFRAGMKGPTKTSRMDQGGRCSLAADRRRPSARWFKARTQAAGCQTTPVLIICWPCEKAGWRWPCCPWR